MSDAQNESHRGWRRLSRGIWSHPAAHGLILGLFLGRLISEGTLYPASTWLLLSIIGATLIAGVGLAIAISRIWRRTFMPNRVQM